ncbi:MAG: hypothetical protein KF798_01020 [Candidatus Paracaedibacteraceae bacterium]|nr:hypothetical protein [Candidatus Paracaedibacteraceae bacterium]
MSVSCKGLSGISKVFALSLALGVSSVSFSADLLTSDQIIERVNTNSEGRSAQNRDLSFTPVQLVEFSGDTITKASTHNLGHLLMALRSLVPSELEWINELQKKAGDIQSDFVSSVAQQAYNTFNWVYSLATADAKGEALSSKADAAALQSWLARTLVDYGIVSEGYRQIYRATEKEFIEQNTAKEQELSEQLTRDKAQKESDRSTKNAGYDQQQQELTGQKEKLDTLVNAETNTTRKGETAQSIKALDVKLKTLADERAVYNVSVDAEIVELDRKFEQQKAGMAAAMSEELQSLKDKYAYIFESIGSSGLKTVSRWFYKHATVRSEYTEFQDLDKILSTKYTTLETSARQAVLDALFSLIVPASDSDTKDTLRKSQVIKGLLGVQDDEYAQIIQRIHEQEAAKSKALAAKANDNAQVVQSVVADGVPGGSTDGVVVSAEVMPSPSLTSAESAVVARVAQSVDGQFGQLEKKKGVTDEDSSIDEEPVALPPLNNLVVQPLALVTGLGGDYRLAANNILGDTTGVHHRIASTPTTDNFLAFNSEGLSVEPRSVASVISEQDGQSSSSSSTALRGQKKNKRGFRGRGK